MNFFEDQVKKAEGLLPIARIAKALPELQKKLEGADFAKTIIDLLPHCIKVNKDQKIICPENDDNQDDHQTHHFNTTCIQECNKLGADAGLCFTLKGLIKPRCICSDLHHCLRNI